MIRTVITPSGPNISLTVPPEFVGQPVEVIAFTIAESVAELGDVDRPFTHFASQQSLSKDWLNPEKDAAWQSL